MEVGNGAGADVLVGRAGRVVVLWIVVVVVGLVADTVLDICFPALGQDCLYSSDGITCTG